MEQQVVEAFKILTADAKVKALLVNIFGGNYEVRRHLQVELLVQLNKLAFKYLLSFA